MCVVYAYECHHERNFLKQDLGELSFYIIMIARAKESAQALIRNQVLKDSAGQSCSRRFSGLFEAFALESSLACRVLQPKQEQK